MGFLYSARMEYEILVRGQLHPHSVDWLGALTTQPQSEAHTLLSGHLPDQAALLGLLACLHNWQIHILSVTQLVQKGTD